MKIIIFKDIDGEKNLPTVIKGTIRLGKTFEIYGLTEELQNQISFLK